MKQFFIAFCFLIFQGATLRAQTDFSWYKNVYAYADSVNQKSSIHPLDTVVYAVADSLDTLHPSHYFLASGQMLKVKKYNEAAFLYHLGTMRYRYYNSVNPNYQVSDDGALFTSFRAVFKESMDLYLRTSVDNYIFNVRRAKEYYDTHDYSFYSREKDASKYEAQSAGYEKFAVDLETNKEKYSAQWQEDRINYETSMKAFEKRMRAYDAANRKKLPQSKDPIVLRTSFGIDSIWTNVCRAIEQPDPKYGFKAYVEFINDSTYLNCTAGQIDDSSYAYSFIFLVDPMTIAHPDHPLLCVGLKQNKGKAFRVIPSAMWCVENNLSIANMDFDEFAAAVDANGIFRGFK